ncbi:DUF3013 family protein [Streptococcus moroccensis]|uniref:DUF3013 family protein n=1 Tax=Streptococcus moroccensis TaxID=1451356 RepID=A0ABT9YS84_9STRE|nr:DUF3013 family protein [Streptococcus moroccensis]MDQ0222864.1 hypothetical protein [Streptococcus moroccensis]
MAKFGFLEVLDELLEQRFTYDYEINWDKKNHAVELGFVLEVQNASAVQTVDADGELSDQDILFEDVLVFYNPEKSKIDVDDYLVALPYEPKKGLSREFLTYLVQFLDETAERGLDDLMDFLADPEAEAFAIVWDKEAFEAGLEKLEESTFYPYPRY